MLRLLNLNIPLLISIGFTVFLIVIHLQRVDYYENPSKDVIENIYNGKTNINIDLSKYENDDYVLNLTFNHIKSNILVNDLYVQIEKITEETSTLLNLIKILPYSGMHSWDIPGYKSFSKIPADLRKLNTESNPYFAYDFIFEQNSKVEANKFLIKIKLNISEDGTEKTLAKELTVQKISKIELKPLDTHSDISFLLIPVASILTVIFALIRIRSKLREKTNA